MPFKTPKQRTRERVIQALYQYLVSGGEVFKIEQQFLNQKQGKISKAFFSNLFINILENRFVLDELITSSISRGTEELGSVEHSILYLGTFELKFNSEVPYKVVINESLALAKLYGAEGSYKLINVSLDKLARMLRKIELIS
ncbi:MAG: transcription antitermination factor NusB [Candidatus Vesicomyosocius endoextente]|uniref:Transcription antitermination protein NusB n=1 Tax=Candidatus Vesicomyosocius endoextente TaxID=2738853 RepID=A0A853G7X1_9GAMM|nr:transcription antitermination factor NusB [Candidatus Vesicomyosocius endoextente]